MPYVAYSKMNNPLRDGDRLTDADGEVWYYRYCGADVVQVYANWQSRVFPVANFPGVTIREEEESK